MIVYCPLCGQHREPHSHLVGPTGVLADVPGPRLRVAMPGVRPPTEITLHWCLTCCAWVAPGHHHPAAR